MIELEPESPSPERPFSRRRKSQPAVELLPHVLEALPVGIGLFELREDDFAFRYGNREFARVLGLERIPAEGRLAGDVFNRADHNAMLELFRLVRVSREPQSHFAAEGRQGGTTTRIWNIDAYPV